MENNKLYLNIFIKGLKYFSIGVFDPIFDKPIASRLHYTIHVVTWLCVFICVIGGCFDGNSFDEIVLSFAVAVNMSLTMAKYAVFSLNRTTVHSLIKLIEIEAPSRVGTDIYIKKSMKDTTIILRTYVLVLVIGTILYLGKEELLKKTETEDMDTRYWEVMHLYLPYDFIVSERFGIFRTVITAFSFYHTYCQVFLDVLSATLFTHLGRQFQAVADLFVNIPYADKEESQIRLRDDVDYHQLLLRYSADLQRMYNVAFLVQLAGCCLPLCICMLLAVNDTLSILPLAVYSSKHFKGFYLFAHGFSDYQQRHIYDRDNVTESNVSAESDLKDTLSILPWAVYNSKHFKGVYLFAHGFSDYQQRHIYDRDNVTESVVSAESDLKNMKTDDVSLINVISHIVFLFLLMYQLFLYTRVADVVTERALLVSEGVYLSDWYLASPSMRRDLSWIIAHAQQPITYTALGIFPITISTFSQILQSVYGASSLLTNID